MAASTAKTPILRRVADGATELVSASAPGIATQPSDDNSRKLRPEPCGWATRAFALLEVGQTMRDRRLPAKDLEATTGRNNVAVDQRVVVEQRFHRVR